MSTNPVLTLSGAGSGIDTASMVAALMSVERQPITKIQDSIKKVNTQKGVVQELNTQLSALRTKAAALFSDPTGLSAKKAVSGDDKIVTGSAGSAAAAGVYNINVTALAQTHTMASVASPPLVGGQSLDITVNGTTKSVAVNGGDTLQDFADRINQTADIGASASVVSGKLVLISKTGGTAGAISLGGTAAAGFGMTTTQAAQDAAATVNGVAVTGSGNTISGAITGLEVTLKSVGSTTLTVSTDDSAVTKKVQDFVDSYNALVGNIARTTKYDQASKTAGALQGDSMIQGLQAALRGVIGSVVTGVSGDYNTAFSIGLDTARDGTLTLDATKLSNALKADPQAVSKVFGYDDGVAGVTAADGLARRIDDLAKQYSQGPMADRLSGYGTRVKEMNDKIDRMNVNLALREQRLKAQFQAMDSAIARMRSSQAEFMSRIGSNR